MEWAIDTDDPGLLQASSVLGRELVAEYSRWLPLVRRRPSPEWNRRWRAAAAGTRPVTRFTPEELRELSNEVTAVLERYSDRRTRRDDTERAIVLFHAFPERRDAA